MQDAAEPQAGEVSGGVFAGLVLCQESAQAEPQVAAVVSAAVQPGIFSVADKLELMTVPCRHEVPDSSGRRYTICKKSWYFIAS